MNRDAVTAFQAKKYEDARKVLKQALDLALVGGAGQAPDQGAHAHPLRHRRHRRASSQRDLGDQAVQEGDRDPVRHRPDQGAGDARFDRRLQRSEGAVARPATPATPPAYAAADARDAAGRRRRRVDADVPCQRPRSRGGARKASRGAPFRSPSASRTTCRFEKIILAYRPEGATEFLGREMKEVADGRYGAEIPTSATSGRHRCLLHRSRRRRRRADCGSRLRRQPLIIYLLGVGVSEGRATG